MKKDIIFLRNLHPFQYTCSSGQQAYECHVRRVSLAGQTSIDTPPFALLHQKYVVAQPDKKLPKQKQKKVLWFDVVRQTQCAWFIQTNDQKKICNRVMHLWVKQRDDSGNGL